MTDLTPSWPLPAATPDRLAQAERLFDFFELQLAFAEHLARAKAIPLGEAMTHATNLRRRFALPDAEAPAWLDFVAQAERLATSQARARLAQAVYAASPDETLPQGQTAFGCFACEPADAEGTIRLHFNNKDPEGPLSRARIAVRRAELAEMFAFIRQTYPTARTVKGASWLYNTEAYRRLYPPAYAASRRPPTTAVRLTGSSSWGQFLKRDGGLNAELRARFVDNWPVLDPDAPWRSFPLPALVTEAPIEAFYDDLGL